VARNPRAQVGFRPGGRDVHPAVDQSIDQSADDFGAVHDLAAPASDVSREAIEVLDLSIEKDDRNLLPGFLVYGRSAAACSYGARVWLQAPPLRHPIDLGRAL
jgi:hypothetical protein